ncbi:MAG: retropepsin-like domain-containing protein [Pirellulales bacterium]|nr:retropepsin-like domain-containing protein [Pirellulales bacterium]
MTNARTRPLRARAAKWLAILVATTTLTCAIGARAAGVPIDGFLPLVGISLTNEYDPEFLAWFPEATIGTGGIQLGASGPHYDVALLDTGAAVSLITTAADAAFKLAGPYPGESDGFRGTESITIGGATGFLQASVSDPLGLYAAGLQSRVSAESSLQMNPGTMNGQTNTSIATLPIESDLPNILGLPFASQYATRIRNSLPQLFELDGKTVRTPAIDFLPLGTGDQQGIARKAPMSLLGSGPSTPLYVFNPAFDLDAPYENPSNPTLVQGGHFLNVNASNDGVNLNNQQFFFDTGASVTVLSELTALQLGIDVQIDTPDFTIQIVGSGGASEGVPGYFIDQFTVLATGGSVTLSNVPILVLDVTNPANPGNIVPGIVGTNVFAGRDIVIDPNPSLGGGGPSAGVYISNPVTTNRDWNTAAAEASWSSAASWSGAVVPNLLGIANVRHVSGGHQRAVVSGAAVAWEANVSGPAATQTMTVAIPGGASLTTFSGVSIEAHGAVDLDGGTLDAQYVELRQNAVLRGQGVIRTGSGPIPGQVENVAGTVVVGNANSFGTLEIHGRFSNGANAALEFNLLGANPGASYGQLVVEGDAAWNGTLSVNLIADFIPAAGTVFTLATYESSGGAFADVLLPAGIQWNLDYGDTALTLTALGLPGDFNNSGGVNAADLAVWQAGFGQPGGYGGQDFLAWQRNYQAGSPIGAVPEPTAAALSILALAVARGVARRMVLA